MAPEQPLKANPAPLGLAGFGLTTVVLSCTNAGLLPPETVNGVVPLAFAYGGTAQIIAGILEFVNGNTFGTVAFTSYGPFWWWYALLLCTIGAGWIKAPAAASIGFVLFMWGVFTLYMWVATFRTNLTLWLVFLTLWITFFLLAFGEFGWGAGWHLAGGYLGILCGSLALYLSFAEVTTEPMGARCFRWDRSKSRKERKDTGEVPGCLQGARLPGGPSRYGGPSSFSRGDGSGPCEGRAEGYAACMRPGRRGPARPRASLEFNFRRFCDSLNQVSTW